MVQNIQQISVASVFFIEKIIEKRKKLENKEENRPAFF